MTKTTVGESSIVSPSSPRSPSTAQTKSGSSNKSDVKVKTSRKPLLKTKPQRSSSFKLQSKSAIKPVMVKSKHHRSLQMLRDALPETPQRPVVSQLDILQDAIQYIIQLQQLIHMDDQQQQAVTMLDNLTF